MKKLIALTLSMAVFLQGSGVYGEVLPSSHRIELNATATDYVTWALAQDLGALTAWSIDFGYQPNDRNFQNEPTAGGGTAGVLISQCDASQRGWQIDTGVETGVMRLIVSDGSTTRVVRISLPGGGMSRITITASKAVSDWTFKVYVDGRLAGSNTATYALGLAWSQTDVLFAVRSGPNDHLDVGAIGRARYWSSELTANEVTQVYSDHRLQDSDGPTPTADIQFGSGSGDTSTSFVCQQGSGKNASLTGTWATGGSKRWNPPRSVGLRKSTSGTATTGWTAMENSSIAAGTDGMQITASATDVRAGAQLSSYPSGAFSYMIRAVIKVPTTGTHVIGVGRVPMRSGAGAVMTTVNLISGISTIYAGEYDADFGDAEVARSTTANGTSPVSGGSDVLIDPAPAANDQYECIMRVDGNHVTSWFRNLSDNQPPLRLFVDLNHEIVLAHRNSPGSPGYPAVFNLINGTVVEVISLEYWDLTVENPRWLFLTDSLANVDQDNWLDGYAMRLNELYEAASPWNWIEPYGCPGSRLLDLATIDSTTGDIAAIGSTRIGIENGANDYGASGQATAESRLQTLQNALFAWGSPPSEVVHISYSPHTAGGVTAEDWIDSQTTVAATDARASVETDGWTDLGDPPGTNNQTAGYYDDTIHMSVTGADAYAQALFDSDAFDTLESDSLPQGILSNVIYRGFSSRLWRQE